jgi:hypothetical protein
MIKTEPINIACKIFSEVLIIAGVCDPDKKRAALLRQPFNIYK